MNDVFCVCVFAICQSLAVFLFQWILDTIPPANKVFFIFVTRLLFTKLTIFCCWTIYNFKLELRGWKRNKNLILLLRISATRINLNYFYLAKKTPHMLIEESKKCFYYFYCNMHIICPYMSTYLLTYSLICTYEYEKKMYFYDWHVVVFISFLQSAHTKGSKYKFDVSKKNIYFYNNKFIVERSIINYSLPNKNLKCVCI